MKTNEYENYIIDAIDLMIQERFKVMINNNYYIEASIININENGTFDIEYNNQTLRNIKAREGLSLVESDIVLICVVNGNFSNKFIDLKRPWGGETKWH